MSVKRNPVRLRNQIAEAYWFCSGLGQGQIDCDSSTGAHRADQLDLAAVESYDVLDDSQSQSGTASGPATALIHPVESFEYPVLAVRRNANAGALPQ